jgi:hypothetical protein
MEPTILVLKQVIVPVVAILAGVGMPVLIVFLVMRFQHLRNQQLFETVRYLADRGQPIPRELLDPPRRPPVAGSQMFRAITLLGAGVGLALMFHLMNLPLLVGVGALLVCIGAAQLLGLRLERGSAPAGGPRPAVPADATADGSA